MMNPVSIGMLPEIQFVSAPAFSPDGGTVAFVVQQADLDNNGYKADLHLYNCATKTTLTLTRSGNIKKFIWSKSGALLFLTGSEKGAKEKGCPLSRIYEISISGGEAVEKFALPVHIIGFYECQDGRFVIAAGVDNTPERDTAYEVFDEIPLWANGKGLTNKKRIHLFVYTPQTGELTRVCEKFDDCTLYSVRGSRILYKAYGWQDVQQPYDGIYLYDMDSNTSRCLLEKDVRRTGAISFWDDDNALVAATENTPYGDEEYCDFYTLNLTDGVMKLLTPYNYSIAAGTVGTDARLGEVYADKTTDEGYYFITTKGAYSYLHRITRDGRISEALTPQGACDSFDVCNGQLVVCGMYEDRLPELYLGGVQITDLNQTTERWKISTPEPLAFTDRDGFEIQGWVIKPVDYQPGKKYPAVLNIHGGPRTAFSSVFHHEMQTWATEGYFVFYCNPRGSDGGGTAFGSLNGNYGTYDYDNLMDFTDNVLIRYPDIDTERLGVAGGSYGGFMTNWIVCHTDRFHAAASQRSISNWITFEHMSDIGHTFTKNTQAVLTREDAQKLWWHSPLKYAANCKTPTLFVHSTEDYRCPMAESLQMFSAFKLLGVETRLCLIRGENHELSRSGRPRNRILRMTEILNWMNRHLKNNAQSPSNIREGSAQ